MRRHREKSYQVYILASKTRTIYVGVTGHILRRMWQHKRKLFRGFTAKYNVDRLVYVESYGFVLEALAREKQLKGWRRSKKVALIEAKNPRWEDLSEGWMDWATEFEPW